MLKPILQVLALCLAVGAVAPAAQTEELPSPFTIQGEWWCSEAGGKTVMKLDFTTIVDGTAPVAGGGVSQHFAQSFKVAHDLMTVTEFAQFDYKRNLTGTIRLMRPGTEEFIGELVISSGKLNNTKTKMKLRGSLALNEMPSRNFKMSCVRVPNAEPDWEGRSTDARVRGRGLRSDKYDVQLTENAETGFPLFDIAFGGPVQIDGIADPNALIGGLAAVNSRGQIAADIDSEAFGNGFGSGKIRSGKGDSRPVLNMKLSTDRPAPARIKSPLLELLR